MLTPLLYPYIKFALGTLYPAYKTWKALKRKDITTRRRWMKYWVSFAAFQMFELVADIILAFIMPFYVEIKMATIMWLVLGTNLIYDSIVDRELKKREKSIDKWLTKVGKLRDELIALVWFEISRCSVKIITSVFSGSLSILVRDDDGHNHNHQRLHHHQVRAIEQQEQVQEIEMDEEEDEEDELAEVEAQQPPPPPVGDAVRRRTRNQASQIYEIIEVDTNQ